MCEEIRDAIQLIQQFVKEATGEAATIPEIAAALKKYFVLNEIKEHILLARGQNEVAVDDN